MNYFSKKRLLRGIWALLTLALIGQADVSSADDSFYKEDWIFSTRPNEDATMTSIDRFGPVGIGIELHQPAFVMKIKNVEDGSPAAETGELKRGQIIETINGEPLRDIDPRIQLGDIITRAEATDGIVHLSVKDDVDSPAQEVVVQIPVLGSYSENWPLDCEKSNRVVRNLADWVGQQDPGINITGGPRMLFLLSTGEEKDLEVVREWVGRLVNQYANREVSGNVNWHLGYGSIPLAEYYLRTGDESILPVIESAVAAAEENYVLGGWSTRGTGTWGYMGGGRMNAAGVHVLTFLLLAKECGVEVDETILHGALQQHFRFAGRGNVPYGDQRPENGFTDNGKNGALAFTMAAAAALTPEGEDSVYAAARDASAIRGFYSTHWMLHGHTGGGVGEIWRSAAMGLMHEEREAQYRSFMDNRTWFYELSRRFNGSFGILGGERYDDTNWGVTMGMTYTVPRKTLRITGASPTEFSKQYELPERAWGRPADDDFYSLKPATDTQGLTPDVEKERIKGVSGRVIMGRIGAAANDPDTIRRYIHHQDNEIRRIAARSLNRHPDMVTELLQSDDARVRRAAVEAIQQHPGSLLTDAHRDILIEMIHAPDESWWVVDGVLQTLDNVEVDKLAGHVDRLIYWAEHDDWWMSSGALKILKNMASEGHAVDRILETVGRVMAANRRYPRWNAGNLTRAINNASPEIQEKYMAMLADVYQTWPLEDDQYREPVHPQSESWFMDSVARGIARLPGGLDRLYELAQERYPEQLLAHRDLFLNSDQLEENPRMQAAIEPIIREELIPSYVLGNIDRLEKNIDNPDGGSVQTIEGLVRLYKRLGINDYDWEEHGPNRTEMEWDYHTFDPVEQPPPGQERARLGRYREVTYPEGMENWNQPDFDAEAVGWERGLAPFASRNGELRAAGGCTNGFCGCGEQPHTLWENEVLLKRGFFEIPPFEEGYIYRILVGGMSHVGAGDGTEVYVNGEQIYHRTRAVDRRAGGRPIGTPIPQNWWSHFEDGNTHLAAKSFLKYYPRSNVYGNYITIFFQRMKMPPIDENLIRKAARIVPMRHADWQSLQEPDTNVDPADGRFEWDGQFLDNPAFLGTWKAVDQVEEIEAFVPGQRQTDRLQPRFSQITFRPEGFTDDTLRFWSGNTLMDLREREALKIIVKSLNGSDYLFIETGGFSPEQGPEWESPVLVFERNE